MSCSRKCLLVIVGLFCYQFVIGMVRYRRTSSHLQHEGHFEQELKNVNKIIDKDCSSCPGSDSVCVPLVQCPAHVRARSKHISLVSCHLHHGKEGVCCNTGQNYTIKEDQKLRASRTFGEKSLKEAEHRGKRKLLRLMEKENETLISNQEQTILPRHDPSFGHFQSQRTINFKEAFKVNQDALQSVFTMQILKERQAISNEDVSLGLDNLQNIDLPCPPPPDCTQANSNYRKLDGTCNNVHHVTWGAARTSFERLLPPDYEDGVWSPRGFSSLPSAREISSKLLPDKDRPHSRASLLTMQFGQFIAHDITGGVVLTHNNGSAISCCTRDGQAPLPHELQHFGCFPIHISPDDDFYGIYGQGCMNFVRTQLAPNHDCRLGFAKQMNGVTHFIDLSHIYGSHSDTLTSLREWSGGRLLMFHDFGRQLCPLSDDQNDCISKSPSQACFKSGDGHANQMITLVVLHTVFSREHNRVADILAILNPHWSDQLLFMEARKIVIAEFQHIIYNEWLPLVLGFKTMDNFRLTPSIFGHSTDYNKDINPGVTSEFGVAAFRFGHSTVDGKLRIPHSTEVDEMVSISELMFHPSRMRIREYYDRILHGLTSQPMQETDPSMSVQLTRYMFRNGNPFGLDLASINIQRGRDHGLQSYNQYRELVGLAPVEDFQEFGPLIENRLRSVYASPHDIDLWIGGLLETPADDSLVGFTFREIIADQFSRLKKGDRYFYEHGPDVNPGHFSQIKLQEIRKTSMARLICDNSDHIELHEQSPQAFLRPDIPGNEPMDCNQLPFVDLSPWKEV